MYMIILNLVNHPSSNSDLLDPQMALNEVMKHRELRGLTAAGRKAGSSDASDVGRGWFNKYPTMMDQKIMMYGS